MMDTRRNGGSMSDLVKFLLARLSDVGGMNFRSWSMATRAAVTLLLAVVGLADLIAGMLTGAVVVGVAGAVFVLAGLGGFIWHSSMIGTWYDPKERARRRTVSARARHIAEVEADTSRPLIEIVQAAEREAIREDAKATGERLAEQHPDGTLFICIPEGSRFTPNCDDCCWVSVTDGLARTVRMDRVETCDRHSQPSGPDMLWR